MELQFYRPEGIPNYKIKISSSSGSLEHLISFRDGKQVSILKGKASDRFLEQIENGDLKEIQLIMAKITENFKHEIKKQ
ncbi:hypothetical protein [Clostridium sp. UBA1056]|uniref:hypothetical protein n=1 Tax=unclassified Clostridium TaxID=2614128 RepID=UPI0032161F64